MPAYQVKDFLRVPLDVQEAYKGPVLGCCPFSSSFPLLPCHYPFACANLHIAGKTAFDGHYSELKY